MNNLLDIRYLGSLLRWPWTWRLLRLAMLGLLLAMIAYGWRQHAVPGVAVRDPLMYTNLATFALWVVWLMGMVPVLLLFGRSWCTICPAGWLNGLVSRFGLRRELPAWLRGMLPVTLSLVVLQLLVYFFAIHRFPDYSALLLAWMLVLALLAGLVWKRRAFCLLLCPAGAVMGLYARIAPWQLRVKNPQVCAGCRDKPCISTETRRMQAQLGSASLQWRSPAEGCPVALVPAEIEQSSDCSLCLNCVRTCCNDNIRLGFRGWPLDLQRGALRPGEALFFLALLGLLSANFAKVYVDLREAVFWLPEQLALAAGWEEAGFYLLATVWLCLLFPLLLILPGMIVYLLGQIRVAPATDALPDPPSPFGPGGLPGLVGRLALPLLPLLLATHLGLALVKLNAKLAYLPLVLQDPGGVKSFLAISVMQTVPAPGVLLGLDLLKWLIAALLAIGFGVSLLAARAVARTSPSVGSDRPLLFASICNLLILLTFYGATVYEWLFVR
ncbi:MAG: 4Fe-4S binding protein [Desulfuromonadales bacterium]|nr:4Fe-4S binding protein [Desulfuromonadales bacterium]